jgi:hypothetical protein
MKANQLLEEMISMMDSRSTEKPDAYQNMKF